MKASILSLMSCAALASAQAIPNFPPCGSGTMLPAISATNCGFTDSACLCKNQSFKDTLMNKIPKVCPVAADVQFYAKFINDQCTGQPGFPLTIGASAAAEPAGPPPSSASPSGAGAAPSPATPASGAHNNAATSVGTAKPATFTGSAASRSMAQEVSAGTVAMAACLAMLGF